jgi:hypothetical protein
VRKDTFSEDGRERPFVLLVKTGVDALSFIGEDGRERPFVYW